MKLTTYPKQDGFYMPAEYSAHEATVMIWCERGGSFPDDGAKAKEVFAEIIKTIARGEVVYLCVNSDISGVKKYLKNEIKSGKVKILDVKTNDCWARDTAPTFLTDGLGVRGVDWEFNAWGGEEYGLYKDWALDNELAPEICNKLNYNYYSVRPFVLEGGSIASNGKGVILTTGECLLSKGRNPELYQNTIEARLKKYLGAEKVVWLPYGVYGDETSGHVDNVCAFLSEDTVALAWSDSGENASRCRENLSVLEDSGLKVVKMYLPENPVRYTSEEISRLNLEDGEIPRSENCDLAASYVNFYVCNSAVLVPQFGDKNDLAAVNILAEYFPDREIVQIFSREILLGGGNIHCITQQIPLIKK